MAASASSSSRDTGSGSENIIVSIDFGTSGCGFAIAFRPASGAEDIATVPVNMFPPGATSEGAKELTALLLDKHERFVAYGREARERYAHACDDGKAREYFYFEKFKMHLAPKTRERDLASATVPAGGTSTKPLMLPFVRVLEFIRKCALERLRAQLADALDEGKIGWVLTLPAIWDDEAKAFMRAAAAQAGLIPEPASPRLLLALEPEGAAISSILLSAPDARTRIERLGTKILVMDCGGGTVDVTVSEVKGVAPLQLGELLPPSGGAWGATYVDRNFEQFMEKLLGASRYSALDDSVRVSMLTNWEQMKHNFDPARPDDNNRVDFAPVEVSLREEELEESDDERVTLAELVTRYNGRYGAGGATCSVTRRGAAIVFTAPLVRSFFEPLVRTTVEHVQTLLRDPVAEGVSFILLVGGFADSPFMRAAVMDAFQRAPREVIIPPKAGLAVVRGATFYGLYPDAFITSRKARYSYAVLVAEDFDPAVHPASALVSNDSGERLAIVMKPLVIMGKDVPQKHSVELPVIPMHKTDVRITCKLYRVAFPVADLLPGVKRTMPGTEPGCVPESAQLATVEVEAGGQDIPLDDRRCRLQFLFGRTELTVRATSDRTGSVVFSAIKYQGAV